ncbi:MAG: ABC transporter ATP-binding protein, partial [Candidatus Cloacimonetes bacterium]|nr:ABC transporter ATP-binding protein [Candidatus Cloacimonadota bacterium]
ILSVTDPILLLWVISITIILLVLFKNIFYYGDKVMFANLRGKMVKTVREMIFRKYLFQTLSFYGKNKVGDSMVRMESDVKIVSNLFIGSAFSAMQDLILLLVHTIIALLMNPRLFLISLVLLPVFSYILGFMGRKIKKYSRRMQNESSNMFSNVEEILSSMPIVKAFVREKHELKKFKTINTKYFNYWRKSLLYSSINIPLSEINSTLMGIMVLMIGGKEVLAPGSSFSYGQFITFLLAIFSMLHPTKNLTRAYADIRKALVSLDRISVILNRELEKLDDPDAIAKKDFTSSIEFRQVSFEYKKNKTVLKDISMQVEKGQKIALVGSSGAGKTTLVNLLPRMYDTKSGEILIDGIEIGNIKLADLRSLFGTVTQDSILFTDTIANNIAYGTLKEITRQDIEKAAQIAYADEFIEKLPLKYDEMLDIRGSNLSGGQRQRLCIARAIVGDPPILIFDEATSALDTEAEQKVQKAIEQATRNRTVFVIAHRLSTVLSSDKIVVIDKGRIIGTGTHQELLNTCTRYETLYNLQFKDNSVS